MNCDVQAQEDSARCFRCIPKGSRKEVLIYLLCQLANQGFCKTPGAVVVNALSNQTGGGFTVTWSADPLGYAFGYRLQISTDPAFGSFYVNTDSGVDYSNFDVGNVLTYVVGGLVGNSTYYVRVVAYQRNCTGPVSNVVQTNTLPLHWNPEAAGATWTDKNGTQVTQPYAVFVATADYASISVLFFPTGVTDVTGAGGCPKLSDPAGQFSCTLNTSITSWEMDGLLKVQTIVSNGCTALTSISASTLKTVNANLDLYQCNNVGFTTISLPSLVTVGGRIKCNNNTAETSFSAPLLTTVGNDFNFNICTVLTTLTVPLLNSVGILSIGTTGIVNFTLPSLTTITVNNTSGVAVGNSCLSISLPKLVSCFGFSTPGPNTTSLSLPLLTTVGNNLILGANKVGPTMSFPSLSLVTGTISLAGSSALVTLSFPALTQANAITITSADPLLATIDLSALKKIAAGALSIQSQAALTTVMLDALQTVSAAMLISSNVSLVTLSLASLTTVGQGVNFSDTLAMTTFTAPNFVPTSGAFTSTWSGQSLQQQYVDAILCQADVGGTTGATTVINIAAGANATPSAAGKTCTDNLRGRGVTVSLNGY